MLPQASINVQLQELCWGRSPSRAQHTIPLVKQVWLNKSKEKCHAHHKVFATQSPPSTLASPEPCYKAISIHPIALQGSEVNARSSHGTRSNLRGPRSRNSTSSKHQACPTIRESVGNLSSYECCLPLGKNTLSKL